MADGTAPRPGSPDALNAWVASTLPRATAFALSLLGDPAAADDVVHDCYCRLLQRAAVYDLARDGTKLLYKAITNACIDRSRQRPLLSLSRNGAEGHGEEGDLTDARSVEPAEVLIRQELEQAVAEGLARLPVAQRAALELKSLGHPLRDIAEALGVSTTNAGVLVHRARQALASHLGRLLEERPR